MCTYRYNDITYQVLIKRNFKISVSRIIFAVFIIYTHITRHIITVY